MTNISSHIEKGIRSAFPTSRSGTIHHICSTNKHVMDASGTIHHICSTNKHVMDAIKNGHPDKELYWDNNLFMYYLRINRNIEAHLQRQTP